MDMMTVDVSVSVCGDRHGVVLWGRACLSLCWKAFRYFGYELFTSVQIE